MADTNDTPNTTSNPAPRRRGRYRRRGGVARDYRLTPRFTDEELATVRAGAELMDMTLTGFCALAALAAARGQSVDPATGADGGLTADELAEMQRELYAARIAVNRTGTNLNQAVAELNATGVPPVRLEHAVNRSADALEQVDAIATRIHHRLG